MPRNQQYTFNRPHLCWVPSATGRLPAALNSRPKSVRVVPAKHCGSSELVPLQRRSGASSTARGGKDAALEGEDEPLVLDSDRALEVRPPCAQKDTCEGTEWCPAQRLNAAAADIDRSCGMALLQHRENHVSLVEKICFPRLRKAASLSLCCALVGSVLTHRYTRHAAHVQVHRCGYAPRPVGSVSPISSRTLDLCLWLPLAASGTVRDHKRERSGDAHEYARG